MKVDIVHILKDKNVFLDKDIVLEGWVRTERNNKEIGFIELNDGTSFKNIQIVYDHSLLNYDELDGIPIGSSIRVFGKLVSSLGKEQSIEVKPNKIEIIGKSTLDNPIQKKRSTLEFLRTIPHLRSRTNTFKAAFKVRSIISKSIHDFFNENNFIYINTPIITTMDAEGAGEMFKVSTLDLNSIPKDGGKVNYKEELLGKPTYLTVSGQLAVEAFCMGFKNVYTFGPTFRAENSNTPKHANEFWMVEPEMAFADINDNMNISERIIKRIISDVLKNGKDEMDFFNQFIEPNLIEKLEKIVNSDFAKMTYTEAISELKKSGVKFEFPCEWGDNLQTEHERFLSEKIFNKPVFVIDYPKKIKAFYMKRNEDGKTVRAMDLLVPGIGEIIGGSQREENVEKLIEAMHENNISPEEYSWYLDIRRFGTFVHSGFGLGLERLVMYITGMKNIRDVIPFPRTPNNSLF